MNLIDKFSSLLDGAPIAAAGPQTVAVVGPASTSAARGTLYQGARDPTAPLSKEAIKELTPKIVVKPPDPREALARVPQPSHATLQAIAKRIGFTAPDKILAKLKSQDADFESMQIVIQNHCYDGAVRDARRLKAEMEADLAEGHDNAHQIMFGKIPTRDELVEQYRPVLVAAKQRLRAISAEAFMTCRASFSEFAAAIDAFAGECEQAEREFADSLQVPYTPSPSLLMIRKAALTVADRAQHATGERPAALADFLMSL